MRKEKVDDNDADSDDNSKRLQKGRGGGGMVITGYRGKKCELLMQFLCAYEAEMPRCSVIKAVSITVQ